MIFLKAPIHLKSSLQWENASTPVPTYDKLYYWLIVILSRVSIFWSHLKFKEDLYS